MKNNIEKIGILFLIFTVANFGRGNKLREEKNNSTRYVVSGRTKRKIKNAKMQNSKNIAELNSEQYAKVLSNFMNRAEKYLEEGDKIKLINDYIENIENTKVSKKALKDNYDADRDAFSLVEVALFMKSMYSEGTKAKELTEADYKKMQKRFVETNKYKQLEQYLEIQPINDGTF